MIRDTVQRFVNEHVKPDIDDHFDAATFPEEPIPKMDDRDLYAPDIESYGLPNSSETIYGLLIQELKAADSEVRSMVSIQGALVVAQLYPDDPGPVADRPQDDQC